MFYLIRNLQREKVSQWDKDNFTFQCKHLFRNFAEFVALHYALSHREDTPYWKANFNKQWEEKLINLKPTLINGFLRASLDRSNNYHFSNVGGLHCITAGMNWSPTDRFTLEYIGECDTASLKRKWEPFIKKLNLRKKEYRKQITQDLSLYSFLQKENNEH